MQLPDVDKFVWVWYKVNTSNYMCNFTEYERNKELSQR